MELNNLTALKRSIPANVRIVCATKYVESKDMLKLLENGLFEFGENRVEAFLNKYKELANQNIIWHFIGHLQTNKAKEVIQKIDYLHSLSSLKLAKIISKNRLTPLKCFVEVNINAEENKSGLPVAELNNFIAEVKDLPNVELVGLMAMSKASSTAQEKYMQFKYLHELLEKINEDFNLNLKELSMGMSDDYEEAIKAGATFIRLGRILWKQEN